MIALYGWGEATCNRRVFKMTGPIWIRKSTFISIMLHHMANIIAVYIWANIMHHLHCHFAIAKNKSFYYSDEPHPIPSHPTSPHFQSNNYSSVTINTHNGFDTGFGTNCTKFNEGTNKSQVLSAINKPCSCSSHSCQLFHISVFCN